MAKTLSEKFRFEVSADIAQMLLDSVAKPPANPSPFARAGFLRSKCDSYAVAALDYYLLNMAAEAKATAVHIPAIALEFFFGEWRNGFVSDISDDRGHEGLRRRYSWMFVFEGCLVWGAALGEWEFLAKIAEYPSEDADIQDGFERVDLLIFLAISHLLLEHREELSADLERLDREGGERGKLVAAVLEALADRDPETFSAALAGYFVYFKKREFPKRNIFRKISVLGTFGYHYARSIGLSVRFDLKYMDHIVRFD